MHNIDQIQQQIYKLHKQGNALYDYAEQAKKQIKNIITLKNGLIKNGFTTTLSASDQLLIKLLDAKADELADIISTASDQMDEIALTAHELRLKLECY